MHGSFFTPRFLLDFILIVFLAERCTGNPANTKTASVGRTFRPFCGIISTHHFLESA